MPFIIAVNATERLDHIDVIDALFGSDAVTVTETMEGFRQRQHRLPDGLWHGKSGPQNTRVSAVLVFYGALPWHVNDVGVQLFPNPWAERPYDGELTVFDKWIVKDDFLVLKRGVRLGEILARGGSLARPGTQLA